MGYKLGVAEVLKECSEITGNGSREKKIAYLHKHSHAALKAVLGFCYDPVVEWMLPEGKPPYRAQPKEQDLQSTLYADFRKLHIFVRSQEYHKLSKVKRENLFVQFLESLDPDDAELIVAIKDRELPYKGITIKLIQEAFPNISKNW